MLCLRHVHLRGDSCCFFRASCFSKCPVRTPLEEKFAPFFSRSKSASSPSGLMAVTLVRSMTSLRPPKSRPAFLQVVPSSATQAPIRVPSTSSVRRDGVSAMDILNMCACTEPSHRKAFAKPTSLVSWQSVESIGAGQIPATDVSKIVEAQLTIVENGDRRSALTLSPFSQSCAGAV